MHRRAFPIPAFRRQMLIGLAAGFAPGLLHMAYMLVVLVWPSMKLPPSLLLWTVGAMCVLCVLTSIWTTLRQRKTAKAALARGGAVCIHCLYLLPTEDDTGTCPECGQTFTKVENRVSWRHATMARMESD